MDRLLLINPADKIVGSGSVDSMKGERELLNARAGFADADDISELGDDATLDGYLTVPESARRSYTRETVASMMGLTNSHGAYTAKAFEVIDRARA